MPDFEPRGCPRGASFSWYIYSPLRVKYPYVRGILLNMWREALKNITIRLMPGKALSKILKKQKPYKQARGKGGFVRADWDEVLKLISASLCIQSTNMARTAMSVSLLFRPCRWSAMQQAPALSSNGRTDAEFL